MTQYLVRAYRHPSGATIRVTVDNADVAEVARYQHAPFAWLRGVGYEVIPRAVAKSQG